MLDHRARTFLAAYRAGSLTQAAKQLHVTQPAVSQHIRQLEAHYGEPLFTKTSRGVEPTAAGALLYQALSAMENDEERLRHELTALATSEERPRLRFGCTRTVADYVAPHILATHLARHPDEHVLMRTGNTAELVALIDEGAVDFALIEGSFDRTAFASARFSREPFVAVSATGTAPDHIEDLLGERLVLREPGSGTREILERNLAAHDLSIRDFADVIELASIPAIKACVAAGAGVSFLYRVAVARELGEGTIVDVTPRDFSVEHDFSLIWQRRSRYATRYRALLDSWQRMR